MFWSKKKKTLDEKLDFTSYVVGKQFPLNRKRHGDGCAFEYLGTGPSILIYYSNPTDIEIDRVETAPFDVGFFSYKSVLYVIANIGGDIIECPFNVNMHAEAQSLKSTGGKQGILSIFLIDADTNILKAMRLTGMPPQFADALWESVSTQFDEAFDKNQYNALVDAIEEQYSVEELCQYVRYVLHCDQIQR